MNMKMKKSYYILFFILILALSLRLYHVTYPYLDHHSWRQTQTAMIARNLYRNKFNIFQPYVDWGGGETISEVEFQITTVLTAFLYTIFGIKDLVGRIIPIMFSLLAIVYMFKLTKFYFNERLALFTSFVYSILPLNVFFTRVLMPESGMLFFTIISLYYYSQYLKNNQNKDYIFSIVFTLLAFLSKQPNLLLLFPLFYLTYEKYKRKLKKKLIIYFVITLSITILYYTFIHFVADNKVITAIGTGSWGNSQLWLSSIFYGTLLLRFSTLIFTQLGFFLVPIGIYLTKKRVFHVWFLSVILYFFIVGKANLIHTYYQMPIIPIGSFYIGVALYKVYKTKYKIASYSLCILLLILSVSNLLPLYGLYAHPAYDAGQKLMTIDKDNSKVLTVIHRKDMGPELLYYADKKGWMIHYDEFNNETIMDYKNLGAGYIAITNPQHTNKNLLNILKSKENYETNTYFIAKV